MTQECCNDEADTFDVLGLANASATVTVHPMRESAYGFIMAPGCRQNSRCFGVPARLSRGVNGSSAYRKGEYFQKELTVSNGSVPVWQSVSTIASLGGSSVTNTGNMYTAKTPEVYAHDLDGNLTSDGHWRLVSRPLRRVPLESGTRASRVAVTWDAENRLTMQQTIGTAPTGAKKQLVFEYDWMGRRIRKQVYDWISSAWTLTQDERFLYDGWNVIAVLSSSTTIKKTLLWGLDLSGTMQGAGGVGGLLAITDYPSSKTYFAGYDGNGNVMVLVDAVSGLTDGNFEYGPFGELIRASGNAATVCPYRFSTKYEDSETGMLYYGYRFYTPNTGRWLSRDPIGERGGRNIFAFVRNMSSVAVDKLGLFNPISGPNGPVGTGDGYPDPGIFLPPGMQPNPIPPLLSPPTPKTPVLPAPEPEFGLGPEVNVGGMSGIIGGEISAQIQVTSCGRICIEKAVTIIIGWGAGAGVGLDLALSGSKNGLDGPNISVGAGGAGVAGLGGGVNAEVDFVPGEWPYPEGGTINGGIKGGGIVGAEARFSFSCAGCAPWWLGPAAGPVASFRADKCIFENLIKPGRKLSNALK